MIHLIFSTHSQTNSQLASIWHSIACAHSIKSPFTDYWANLFSAYNDKIAYFVHENPLSIGYYIENFNNYLGSQNDWNRTRSEWDTYFILCIFAHFSTEPEVADDILAAYLAADASRETAETVIDNNRNLQPTIAAIESETDEMKTMVQNTLDAEQTLDAERKFYGALPYSTEKYSCCYFVDNGYSWIMHASGSVSAKATTDQHFYNGHDSYTEATVDCHHWSPKWWSAVASVHGHCRNSDRWWLLVKLRWWTETEII